MKRAKYNSVFSRLILLFTSVIFLLSCDSEEGEIINTEVNPLKLQASGTIVELDMANPDTEILSFMWEPAEDKSAEGTIVEEYLFKMDMASREFETAIPTTAVNDGVFYKTFTTRELNDLLFNQWGISPGTEIGIEARVIARYSNPDKFVMPAVSTVPVRLVSHRIESKPLYLLGTSTPAGDNIPEAIEMTELLQGETYIWRGDLTEGTYYFTQQKESEYPVYLKDSEGMLAYTTASDENLTPFTVEKDGKYAIAVNLTTMRITCEEVFFADRLSLIGSGTNWGWPAGAAGPDDPAYGGTMIWSTTNPHECEITTELKAGEFRICIAGQNNIAFRPYNAETPITPEEQSVIFMNRPDYKWRIQAADAGTYQIILDTKNYKIRIIKK